MQHSGYHRYTFLVCGHSFGLICIRTWCFQHPDERPKCPQCGVEIVDAYLRNVMNIQAVSSNFNPDDFY